MKKLVGIIALSIALGAVLSGTICLYYKGVIHDIQYARLILVSKQEMKLRLIDYKGKKLFETDIACGLNYGNKRERGDWKTPEGVFSIADIQNAKDWAHDFGDGKGKITGAYGSYFIRLAVPGHKGIGIHGTHDSLSIRTRVTEGCIRLRNEDLEKLVTMIEVPMTVIITPSAEDEKNN